MTCADCFFFCDGGYYCDCECHDIEHEEKLLKILRAITLHRRKKVILKTNLHQLYIDNQIKP